MEPIIDLEWRALTRRAGDTIPDEPITNQIMLDEFNESGTSPRGCNITNGRNEDRAWVAKMYIGGKQRVLGYGTCYQCARLYDAVYWRFRKYRTERPNIGQIYNFSESQAADDNMQADINSVICDMEKLLLSRGLLQTQSEREESAKKRLSEYRHDRYTSVGRVEKLIQQLIDMIEQQSLAIERLEKKIATPTSIAPVYPFDHRGTAAPQTPGYIAPYIGDPIPGDGLGLTCKNVSNVAGQTGSNVPN